MLGPLRLAAMGPRYMAAYIAGYNGNLAFNSRMLSPQEFVDSQKGWRQGTLDCKTDWGEDVWEFETPHHLNSCPTKMKK